MILNGKLSVMMAGVGKNQMLLADPWDTDMEHTIMFMEHTLARALEVSC